jgi:hypothetical protein
MAKTLLELEEEAQQGGQDEMLAYLAAVDAKDADTTVSKKKSEKQIAEATATADKFTGGLEKEAEGLGLVTDAARSRVEATKAAPIIGMSTLAGMNNPNLSARQRASMLQQEALSAGAGIAEAEGAVGEAIAAEGSLMAQQAEEAAAMGAGGPLGAQARADAADWSATFGAEGDAIIDSHTHWYGDGEGKMYNEMMELIDDKAMEIFGSTIRGSTGRALFQEVMDIANGRQQADPIKTEFAKAFKKAYQKAEKARKS